MTPLAVGVLGKDPTLKRVFTAKFAPQILRQYAVYYFSAHQKFPQLVALSNCCFFATVFVAKNEYFCLQNFWKPKYSFLVRQNYTTPPTACQ